MAGHPFYIGELRLSGSRDIGRPVQTSTLQNPIDQFFMEWPGTDNEVFDLFRPSLQLATRLFNVGMPYISSFLPSEVKDFWGEGDDGPFLSEIHLNPNPTQKDIDAARREVSEGIKDVNWRLNDTIQRRWQHLGETRLANSDEPWEMLHVDTVLDSDKKLKLEGKERRPLTIGLMEEFVTALRDSDPTSERRLRATFMAAVTMVHEAGHAIFHSDFRSISPSQYREPYVEGSCEAELGFSFVHWIFSGFHPLNIPGDVEFKDTLFWVPQDTLCIGERLLYNTHYSIPISYLERMVSEEFWKRFGGQSKISFSRRARKALRPNTDVQSGQVVIAMMPNWTYSHLLHRPLWKEDYHYRLPGFRERDRIKGLSVEEIEREREKTEENREHASLGKRERHWLYRLMRYEKGLDVPDLDNIEFWEESSPEPSKPMIAKPPRPAKQNLDSSDSKPNSRDLLQNQPKSKSASFPSKRPRSEELERLDLFSVIEAKCRGKVARVVDIENLIYELGPAPQKPRIFVTQITGIGDYLVNENCNQEAGQGG